MTIEEKISVLKQVKETLLASNSWLESTKNPIEESFDAAIKSLEAWEKLRKEIYEIATKSIESHISDREHYVLIRESDVLNIIGKHLAEVENGSHKM